MSVLLHQLMPVPTDGLESETSEEQVRTEQAIRELLALYIPQAGKPASTAPLRISELALDKTAHARWLRGILKPLPAPYTTLDASRPWLLYWSTHSLALMGQQLDSKTKQRAIDTIRSFWNEQDGGFGGGPGQMAHLAPTYASVSALCYLGGESAWDWIDRQALHDWMISLKQPDGSFVMHAGGEVDVRGCYCALTTAVLLNILTPDLAEGTSDFVVSCQTYEGGIASASQPSSSNTPSPPLGEAHGGYTFCALASYYALHASPSLHLSSRQYLASSSNGSTQPSNASSKQLNARSLLRWASHMQGLPIEAGGFRGRTNKLVDGCYSWWCGGLFAMIQSLLATSSGTSSLPSDSVDLFNRTALQEYVLIAAQAQSGGLRDKPGKGADAYHSCYNLSGLSAAQHIVEHRQPEQVAALEADWWDIDPPTPPLKITIVRGKDETLKQANKRMRDIFVSAMAWRTIEKRKIVVGIPENELLVTHPVYNLVMGPFESMLRWSYGQPDAGGIEEVP